MYSFVFIYYILYIIYYILYRYINIYYNSIIEIIEINIKMDEYYLLKIYII